jgi:hypothetical protein
VSQLLTSGSRRSAGRGQRGKVALGERGPVSSEDGEPDFNRRLVRNTPYSAQDHYHHLLFDLSDLKIVESHL